MFVDIREKASKTGRIDLSAIGFFTPSNLLPILIFIRKAPPGIPIVPPDDPNVNSYLWYMQSDLGAENRNKQNYLPVVSLPKVESECAPILNKIYDLGENAGGKNAFRYLIGELVDNIYQHSLFKNALIMVQKYPRNEEMHLCIIDDGITIRGSLANAGMILDDDQAIIDAIQGASSKNDDERGKGLGSSMKLLTEGYRGNVLILSGGGAVHYDEEGAMRYLLSDMYKYEGTMISMIIPLTTAEVNVFDYADL
ncbi:MAG: ATP-binding protein [Methanomassiliicoccales archaeon]|nr:ATP-binding protein [Methanomassiliicoccales archaeon]